MLGNVCLLPDAKQIETTGIGGFLGFLFPGGFFLTFCSWRQKLKVVNAIVLLVVVDVIDLKFGWDIGFETLVDKTVKIVLLSFFVEANTHE